MIWVGRYGMSAFGKVRKPGVMNKTCLPGILDCCCCLQLLFTFRSALHYACLAGSCEVASELIRCGLAASQKSLDHIESQDNHGLTPVFLVSVIIIISFVSYPCYPLKYYLLVLQFHPDNTPCGFS